MDQQTLLATMTGFVIIAAIALIIQAGFLFGIYKASRGMNDNVQRLMPKIEAMIETSRQTIDDSRRQIADITSKAGEVSIRASIFGIRRCTLSFIPREAL